MAVVLRREERIDHINSICVRANSLQTVMSEDMHLRRARARSHSHTPRLS